MQFYKNKLFYQSEVIDLLCAQFTPMFHCYNLINQIIVSKQENFALPSHVSNLPNEFYDICQVYLSLLEFQAGLLKVKNQLMAGIRSRASE